MRNRLLAHTFSCLTATAAASVLVVSSGPASAAGFGGALQPGSSACTDWLRTDGGGVYIRGYAWGAGNYTWTMLMSDTVGGPEVELFRATTREVMQQVFPPAGRHFYRTCLNVAGKEAGGYRLLVGPGVGMVNPVYGVGPHTATLTPGSTACGEWSMSTIIMKGSSDRTVLWSVRGTDMDYAPAGEIFSVSSPTIDQGINLPSWIFSIDGCATNTSSGTATLRFDFVDP
jgi:hypothetical protein